MERKNGIEKFTLKKTQGTLQTSECLFCGENTAKEILSGDCRQP